jgi:hypothetical protein
MDASGMGGIMEVSMQRLFVPAEYELPPERDPRGKRHWITALAGVILIVTATVALVTANDTASDVSVEVGR